MSSNMKIIVLMLVLMSSICMAFSQERSIQITNEYTKEEITIKENKRIRIKTVAGKKITGNFKIVDNQSILTRFMH